MPCFALVSREDLEQGSTGQLFRKKVLHPFAVDLRNEFVYDEKEA